jgi:hypothetical protein
LKFSSSLDQHHRTLNNGRESILVELLVNGYHDVILFRRNLNLKALRADAKHSKLAARRLQRFAKVLSSPHSRVHQAGKEVRLLLVECRLDCDSFFVENHRAKHAREVRDALEHLVDFQRLRKAKNSGQKVEIVEIETHHCSGLMDESEVLKLSAISFCENN